MDNKTLVLTAVRELFGDKDATAVDRYFGEPYIQHNPNVPDGTAALRGLAQGLAQNPAFKYDLVRVIADGDTVALHGRYTGFLPQPAVAFDIFRVQDGKIIEHWDCMQVEATHTASGRTMLDGPAEVRDYDHTEANKRLVRDLVNSVFIGGQMDKLPGFFDGDAYLQHNPNVPDGLSGLGQAMAAMAQQGMPMRVSKNHRIIGEGNFVLSQSEGSMGDKPVAFYDLFRIENGKVAEHWDVIQDIPSQTASGNAMF
jgi:predicted SnoaL-like aldol condensation-catalyzing enzyme